MSKTFDEIRDLIAKKLSKPAGEITETSDLLNDLKADSLDIVEIVMELEERYNVSVSDEEASALKTVGDVAKFIDGKKK